MDSPATKEHSTRIQAKGNTVKLIGEFMPMDAGDMEMCATDQDGVFALRDMDDMPETVEVDGMTMPPPAGMMFATAGELRDMAESIMTGPASKMMGSLQTWGKPGP